MRATHPRTLLVWVGLAVTAAAQSPPPVISRNDIVYGTVDGVALMLDLARPAAAGRLYPLVVCIHGGTWQEGSKAAYGPTLQMLAQAGYAAAALDYRFAPKYPFPAQILDVRLAVRYLRSHAAELSIDPERIASLGDSAGGQLALLLGLLPESAFDPKPGAAQQSSRVQAVVNLYGPSDMARWRVAPEVEADPLHTVASNLLRVFGTNDPRSAALEAASPLHYVQAGAAPVLTFHGDADPVVFPEQSEWLHVALRKAGVQEKLVMVKGATHGFKGPDLQMTVQVTLDFLNTHLKPAVRSAAPAKEPPPFARIDAHAHVAPPPPAFYQMLDRLRTTVLNVTLIDPHAPGFNTEEPMATMVADLSARSGKRVAWAATFDPGPFEAPQFAASAIRHLQSSFDRGAVAVKIYKSIGLDLKSAGGAYVLPDDRAFFPVLEMIARSNKTVLAHLAEPRSSWLPLDPGDPHYGYYKSNPDWHMHKHPERPAYEAIIAARDRMLQAHPALRVVGCHLGSMEHDTAEIAKRLDRYPNFAVDTAARVENLRRQPRDKVRAFLIRYQDRVLWGTDAMELAWSDPASALARWERTYVNDWDYFAGDLELPREVLVKIFHDNAVRWIPGLVAASSEGK